MEYSVGAFKIYDKIAAAVRVNINPNSLLRLEFETLNLQRFLGIAIAILGLILSIVIAIKTDKLSVLLFGLLWALVFPIIFWSNLKIIKHAQLLSLRYKLNISEISYLEILIVIYMFGSAASVAVFLYFSVLFSNMMILIYGILICISLLINMAYLARHELLGIGLNSSATVWENALCLLSVPLRIVSRLAGLAFAFANLFFILALLYVIYLTVSDMNSLDFSQILMSLSLMGGASTAIYVGSPLIVYLITLPLYLLFRVIAQVAGIPASDAAENSEWRQVDVHINFAHDDQSSVLALNGEAARDLYLSGTINPNTLVWTDGMEEWQPIAEVGF